MKILLAGGGTGGHLLPALALAQALREARRDIEPVLVGAARGIEADVLPRHPFRHYLLPIEPIYRHTWWKNLRWPFVAGRVWRAVGRVLDAERPAIVIGTGGYAAGPVVWRAARRGILTVLQEQNAFPGLTTRWLARRARQVHLGFPEARERLRPGRGTEVFALGNPIRPPAPGDRAAAARQLGLVAERPTLLVFGGSQGARAINYAMAGALERRLLGDVNVLWGTGAAQADTLARYAVPGRVVVRGFFDPMTELYCAADLVVARAGAITVAELCALGKAGMSGLALLARQQGIAITGCDNDPSGAADLAALGVEIWRGHDAGHVAGARAVVVTAAVPGDHPELERARALGVPVVRRADALGQAVAGGTVVAVSGTHGKTTTTVMVTEALAAAGRDPTGLAGGRVARWGGNARLGGRELYVVEADEFDRAFLSLAPTVAVVTNVEADHLECYGGSVTALEQAFVEFAGRARRVIVGGDDPGAGRVAAAVQVPVWRVGLGADADVRIVEPRLDEGGASTARIALPGGRTVALRLRVPGLHNLRNAAMALAVAHELGADLERGLAALAEFGGVGRRFERVGEARGVTVVDDYAHHPTEVQATLAAARQTFPRRRLVAVFQPHLFSRTALHGEALGRALAAADVVVVAPIYAARERPVPGVTADLVVRGAARAGATTVAVRERAALTARVAETVRAGDVVFTLGAGDITRVGPDLLAQLGKRAEQEGGNGR